MKTARGSSSWESEQTFVHRRKKTNRQSGSPWQRSVFPFLFIGRPSQELLGSQVL